MNNLIKKVAAIIILIAAALSLGKSASASEFKLPSMSEAELRGTEFKAVPVPHVSGAARDEFIGTDLSIRIPFKFINKVMLLQDGLSIIDPSAPVLERSGELIKVVNFRLDIKGIRTEPVITLKPWLEGKDRLAVKVMRVRLHAAASPTPGASGDLVSLPRPDNGEEFNLENTVSDIMGIITDGIKDAISESLAAQHSSLRAADMINSEYDKAAWTLHTVVSPAVLNRLMPEGMVGEIHMNGFSFDDSALFIRFGSK